MKPVAISIMSAVDATERDVDSTGATSAVPERGDAERFDTLLNGDAEEDSQGSQHATDGGGEEGSTRYWDTLAATDASRWPSVPHVKNSPHSATETTDRAPTSKRRLGPSVADGLLSPGGGAAADEPADGPAMRPDDVLDSEDAGQAAAAAGAFAGVVTNTTPGQVSRGADAPKPKTGGGAVSSSQQPVHAASSLLQQLADAATGTGPAKHEPVGVLVDTTTVFPAEPVPTESTSESPSPLLPSFARQQSNSEPILEDVGKTGSGLESQVDVGQLPLESSDGLTQTPAVMDPDASNIGSSRRDTAAQQGASDSACGCAGEQVALATEAGQGNANVETGGGGAQGESQDSPADDGLPSGSLSSKEHTRDVDGQHPAATLGDTVLDGLNRNSVEHSLPDVAPDRGRLTSLVNQVVERMLVSEKTGLGKTEVRLVLKDTVLPKTEVVVARDGGALAVRFLTRSDESSAWLHHNQRLICNELAHNLNRQVSVDISGEQQDGRSRGQRDLFAEAAEAEE